jgi:hypothetical protein
MFSTLKLFVVLGSGLAFQRGRRESKAILVVGGIGSNGGLHRVIVPNSEWM